MAEIHTSGTDLRAGDSIKTPDHPLFGRAIEDVRPLRRDYPMTVAVKVGSSWVPLPAEGFFLIERPE